MIKILNDNEYIKTKIDSAGYDYSYLNNHDQAVWKGANPYPLSMVNKVLQNINFPLEKMHTALLICDGILHDYLEDKKQWSGNIYNGRAYANYVIIGSRFGNLTEDSQYKECAEVVTHEFGHSLMYTAFDCNYHNHTDYIDEFMKLRGIESFPKWGSDWYTRPAEIWAEDFRYFFAPPEGRKDGTFDKMYIDYGIGFPTEEIKEYFLYLADSITKLTSIDSLIRHLETVDLEKSELHIHHTWKPDHSDFNGFNHVQLHNAMERYHEETREFSDIAQHLTLYPDGIFVAGRDFAESPNSAAGFNTSGVIMVEIIGNFDIGNDILQGVQKESILKLARYFHNKGTKVYFHNELGTDKTCPGTSINKNKFMSEVLNMAEERIFPDVPKGHYAEESIKKAVEKGIIKGNANGTFGLDIPVDREDLVVILDRLGLLD